uniref:uncharacterized protein LOC124070440 isoform X2 n=1 Tax=Scatophagus argus TaxID=75038 RepID=UPI001ED81551|nr:uncharacterized protein LOC124070440 isoform X2 [Scatophagus argus]
MILTGRSPCLPSQATVRELFFVARDASIIPDISLDPVLTTFLSLDSSAALQHQYGFVQRGMSREQQSAFGLSLTEKLGGSSRVTHGGVGVVALALSMLFDQVAQQVRGQSTTEGNMSSQSSQPKRIFGISSSSRIGWIIHRYLLLVPGIANNQEKMAETTELFDNWLKLELLDHYERMTNKKRMSSVSMQQWLAGAAFHLHMRIHQVRLNSVPLGSAESLRRSYKSGLSRLVQDYSTYLYRNIQETAPPGPGRARPRTASGPRQTNTFRITNTTCSGNDLLNGTSSDKLNETTTANATANTRNETTVSVRNRKTPNSPTGYSRAEGVSSLGLLVIEPQRNVSHNVQHHPCESPAIQQALVTRIVNAQDLDRNRNFFRYPEKVFHSLFRQRDDFELKTN